MAYFALLWKARTILKYKLDYESEKINSIMISKTQIPKQSLSLRWRLYRCDTQKRISRTFRRWYPEGSTLSNFLIYLKTDQTFPNFVLKSFVGFVGGIVLTYLCFIFFVFQLSISLIHATIMSSVIGVLLTLGLAFSYRIRCLVFLLIPQFFSRVGRYTLTCYALVLILTGPATNTLKNSEVLSESLACGQEQLKTNLNNLNLLMTKPLNDLKDSIELMVKRLRTVAVKMKEMVLKINRLILSVAQIIQTGHLWLNSRSTLCTKRLGTPYLRCVHSIQNGIQRYKKIFGTNESTLCNTEEAMKKICSNLKPNILRGFFEQVNGNIASIIKKRLTNFSDRISHMLFIEVHVHHSYFYSSNTTQTASQAAAGIVTEIRKRADPLLTWLSWSSYVTSAFLLLIIFRAKNYQHMFETSSRFDNRYITKEIRIIDLKRLREGRETILPLNRRERAKYITTTTFRLVASEKAYLNRSIVFMTITTFKLLIHIVADYSLYWVLKTIRYHGRLQSPIQPGVQGTSIHIGGSGPTTDLLKAIFSSLNVLIESPRNTPVSCLPNPHPPDFKRYMQIGVLIFLLWFFAIFEPYGLRLRHVVMGHYQPERAKARAVWLYNHILRTRGGFMKFARRKLHRVYKYRPENKLTLRTWLNDRIPFYWLRIFFGTKSNEPHCLLCGTIYYKQRLDTQLIRCKSYNCPGVYCSSCFADIGELCTICLSPEDYGDMSNASLEKGSSDDSDNEDEKLSKKSQSFCNVGVSKFEPYNDNRPNETSNRYQHTRFPSFKKNSTDHSSLMKRKNMISTDRSQQNNNHVLILESIIQNITKKHLTAKHTKKQRKAATIFCQYCGNSDNNTKKSNNKKEDKQIKPSSKKTLVSGKLRHKNDIKKHSIDNWKQLNTKRLVGNCNSESKSFKSLPTLTKLLRKASESSFYRITLSKNSINVHKVKHRIFDSNCLQKIINSTRKCKMKSRHKRYRRLGFLKNRRRKIKNTIVPVKNEMKYEKLSDAIVSSSCKYNTDLNMDKVDDNKENKKSNQNDIGVKSPKINSGSCYGFRRARMIFSDYWKNIKINIASFSHVFSSMAMNDMTISKEKKNHKRRKKKHKNMVVSSESKSGDVDNEEARKYRVSAYLFEQEWMKRQSNVQAKIKTEVDDANIEISEALACIVSCSSDTKLDKKEKKNKGNLLSVCTQLRNIRTHKSENNKRSSATISEICKKFGYNLIAVSSSNRFIENIMRAAEPMFRREKKLTLSKVHTPNIDKQLKFYGSICHDDFQEKVYSGYGEKLNEKCPDSINLDCEDFENYDPFNVLSDYSSSTKKCFFSKNRDEFRKTFSRFKSDISERVMSGLRCSVSMVRSLCSGGCNNSNCSYFQKSKKSQHCANVSKKVSNAGVQTDKKKRETSVDPCKQVKADEGRQNLLNIYSTKRDADTETKNKLKEISDEDRVRRTKMCTCATQYDILSDNKLQKDVYHYTSSTCSSSNTILSSSIRTDVSTCTDATICSLAYWEKKSRKRKPRGTKLVTKANQATATEIPTVCDVSTTTNDWWSPIVEKRRFYRKTMVDKAVGERHAEKQGTALTKKIKNIENADMRTNEKNVTFGNQAQIISTDGDDVMSPTRYLLESQKYYNELFSSKYYAPHIFPINLVQPKCPVSQNEPSDGVRQYRELKLIKLEIDQKFKTSSF